MSQKVKDTEYLSISTRIRAMENRLLTRERMERMLDARTDDEAAKILAECGYAELPRITPSALDAVLSQAREEIYRDLSGAVPNPGLVDVFRIKYDYHNAKVLVKSRMVGADPARLLVQGGRCDPQCLREDFEKDELSGYTPAFRAALAEAGAVMGASGDPQGADMVLDRACFAEMLQAARQAGSSFLEGYVRLSIDAANLRSAVRAARMGRGADFLARVLLPGGNVAPERIAGAKAGELAALFSGALGEAAALGGTLAAPGSGRLTEFERQCDNALMGYMAQARRIPFGEQPVVAYLAARESEFTAVRIILSGRMEHLGADVIRERLRDAYV